MIKILVSIEPDLTSSLAMRFACQLGGLIEMEIHPVYVVEAPSHESSVGAGWASRTWERQMIQTGEEEIASLIRPELDFCPVLREPRVIYGDRESELLRITEKEEFDFFVEGVHFPWTQQLLLKHLHTKFCRKLSVPQVLVRTPRKLNQVLLLCLDPHGTQAMTRIFQYLWHECKIPVVLAHPAENEKKSEHTELREAVMLGQQQLKESGCIVSVEEALPRPGSDAAKLLKDYGLVAIAAERDSGNESALTQWLSLIENTALLAFH